MSDLCYVIEDESRKELDDQLTYPSRESEYSTQKMQGIVAAMVQCFQMDQLPCAIFMVTKCKKDKVLDPIVEVEYRNV